jgi:hypothetical protein
MGRTRKAFLAAVSAAGAGLALTGTSQAQQTPSPLASPSAKPAKAASPLAKAYAERMRSFDPQLTDKQVDDIAHQMDQVYDLRHALRPKHQGLSNGDAPTPQFKVNE